jgi:hypothetical protein
MGFSSMLKDVAKRASSKLSDVVKKANNIPVNTSTSPDVGSLYKRLTAADIEEENKAKMGMKKGGKVSSASKRADGIATKGKTRGKMV